MKKLFLIALILCSAKIFAQQDPQYSMYMWNQLSVNPAYAGSRECLSSTLLYRSQWVKMDGAPKTINFGIHSPLRNENAALGFNLTNDKLGVSNYTNLSVSYAYRLMLNSKSRLSFGLQGVLTSVSHNYNQLTVFDIGDENFTNPVKNILLPNFGAGVYYNTSKGYVGLALPHIINENLYDKSNGAVSSITAKQYRHLFFMIGKVYDTKNADVKFKPSLLLKMAQGAPLEFDFNATFFIKEVLHIGASLRSDFSTVAQQRFESIDLMTVFNLNNTFQFGFAYDISITKLKQYNNGSIELMLGYEINPNTKKIVTPRYF